MERATVERNVRGDNGNEAMAPGDVYSVADEQQEQIAAGEGQILIFEGGDALHTSASVDRNRVR